MNLHGQAVLKRLCSKPHTYHETVCLQTLKDIMLHTGGEAIAAGLRFNIVSERLCPGVYNLSLKLKEG